MPDPIPHPGSAYPVDETRTGIAIGYRNPAYIADLVLPRVPVGLRTYRYTSYPLAESYTLPDTTIGRRSDPTTVHLSATEMAGMVADYGLQDLIPDDDIRNIPPGVSDPRDRSVMTLTDLLTIGREKRVADLVLNADTYADASKVTLSGNDQWSSGHASSDPVEDILNAIDAMIVAPTHLVMGSSVWLKLRSHKKIARAVNATSGDVAIAARRAIADLFELEDIVVGQSRINTAAQGQPPSLDRIWGKSALLYRRSPAPDPMGPPQLGVTASYRGLEVYTRFEGARGARGLHRIRVVDSCEEQILAPAAGYLIRNAVA